MYYVESGRPSVYGHVALNAGSEASLEKLGWFRFSHGRWGIRRGEVQMQEAHNVHYTNCKKQAYIEQFHATYFASPEKRTSDLKLGRRLSSNAWVRKAIYDDRAVTLEHGEGVAITFTIHTETRPKIVYDGSYFEHFEGFIQMDEHSNRFLHVTFYEARGTILGHIYNNKKKTASLERIHFQVDYGRKSNYTTRILIPSSVNGTRYVCFYPEGDVDRMSCQWLA
ncbi:unnamed protein product [Cylicocyclus nassatus]|uniref:Uncharacterized protein n=1 Tax=Cylicocyclus nassatus TaxID=53992 RepID=A0AA36GTD9_CYLNA|nr:unnamed protein product [Cylicocyclus nassatus]